MGTPLEMLAAAKWDIGQLAALVYKLGEENARAILSDDVRVRTEPSFFSTPQEQVRIWQSVFLPEGPAGARSLWLDFPNSSGIIRLPAWPSKETVAPVLTLVGCSAEAELKLYWELLNKNTKVCWDWTAFPIDHEKVAWWKDSKNHDGLWRFEWQAIDFSSHSHGRKPCGKGIGVNEIREAAPIRNRRFPSAGILAALLVHPKFYKMLANREVLNMDIAGYNILGPGCSGSLVVSVQNCGSNVEIKATRPVAEYDFSIPTFAVEGV